MASERRTKSGQLQEKLLELVEDGRSKSDLRFWSVREIAREHNVSTITAGKVVSNLISHGFLVKREGVGTFIAPNSAGKPEVSKEVALCVGRTSFSFFFYELFATLVNHARQMGLSLSVFGTGNPTDDKSLRELVERALNDGFENLLIGPLDGPALESVEDLLGQARNVVLFGMEEKVSFDSVSTDTYKAGRLAGKYFAEMGHRDILLMGSHLPARTEGFLDGLAEEGVQLPAQLVMPSDGSERSGYEVLNYALKAGLHFTGVMSCSNESTLGALFALQGANLEIPEDVSLVSMGNAGVMRSVCRVTSISLRPDEIAKEALVAIEERLDGNTRRFRWKKIDPILVDRGSVKQLKRPAPDETMEA